MTGRFEGTSHSQFSNLAKEDIFVYDFMNNVADSVESFRVVLKKSKMKEDYFSITFKKYRLEFVPWQRCIDGLVPYDLIKIKVKI